MEESLLLSTTLQTHQQDRAGQACMDVYGFPAHPSAYVLCSHTAHVTLFIHRMHAACDTGINHMCVFTYTP